MKFGNVVRVETSRYLTKITTLRRKADCEGSRSERLCLVTRIVLVARDNQIEAIQNLPAYLTYQSRDIHLKLCYIIINLPLIYILL